MVSLQDGRYHIGPATTPDDNVKDWIEHETSDEGRFKSESELLLTLVRQEMQRDVERAHNGTLNTEFEETYRDAAVVKEGLGLAGEPAIVEMVGRNVKFVIPGGGGDE